MKRHDDDSPDPVGTTPKRLADELDSISFALLKLSIRTRSVGQYLAIGVGRDCATVLQNLIRDAADVAADISFDVKTGLRDLSPRFPADPDRPLIALAEKNRKPLLDGLDNGRADLRKQAAFEPGTEPRKSLLDLPREPESESARRARIRAAAVDPAVPRNGFVEMLAEPKPETTVGELSAAERKARKKEADRKYAEKKRAAKALAKALGNPVEASGEPPPKFAGREPVIAGPTEPARTMGQPDIDCVPVLSPLPEGYQRIYSVTDSRPITRAESRAGVTPERLGEVTAMNIDEARRAAFRLVGDRAFEVVEKMVDAGKGQAVVRMSVAEPAEQPLSAAMLSDRPGEEWRSLDIDQLGISYTLCAALRDREIENAGQLAYALNDELGLMGETELDVIELEKAIGRVRRDHAAAPAKPDRKAKPAPEPVPDPLDGLFVAWSGRNPLCAIRAKSLREAIAYVKLQYPADSKIEVRPDLDGTIAKRKLPIRDLISAQWPAPVESDRTWEVFDTRLDPHPLLGEVTGANITRAQLAAEAEWPDVPKRAFKIIERYQRGRRPANRIDDADVAEFRKGFEANDDYEQMFVESRKPDPGPTPEPEPAKRGRRKTSGTSTVIGEDRAERIAAENRAMRSEVGS